MRRSVLITSKLGCVFITAALIYGLPYPGTAVASDVSDYYTVKPLFNPYPGGGRRYRDWNVKNLGPVGIGINLTKPPKSGARP